MDIARAGVLRQRGRQDSGKVANVELFFDLVFVFAVTQVSHGLLQAMDVRGAVQSAMVLLAVWWLWIFTAWSMNWLEPGHTRVRLLLFALMLGSLVLAAVVPRAFVDGAPVFAGVFALMQVGRSLFMVHALRDRPAQRRNFVRISAWLCTSAIAWIAGGLQAEQRMGWWLLALAIEYVAPLAYFRVPGLGRSDVSDWDVDGAHLAERCMLFVIIALGESLLITGATFSGLDWNARTLSAFAACFAGTVAMWWLYFDSGAEHAAHRVIHAGDPGRIARSAYTYLHLPIIAGIILCAVADERVLLHPDHADVASLCAILGGPALYLAGCMCFKWVTRDRRFPPLSHVAGLVVLAVMACLQSRLHLSALALGIAGTVALLLTAAWETVAQRARSE